MPKRMLIVESPTKAKTLKRYVGKNYTIKASVGHVKDLPKSRMGVDIEKDFHIDLEVIRGKKKVLKELRDTAKKVDEVFLAPDPDREGEAIAWHIADEVRKVNPKILRVDFHEITKRAVQDALKKPRELNENLYNAQQARRVLDRLVGYEISPLLWEKVQRGLSAGRVQSVAVRLIVDREKEIEAFNPKEYWTLDEFVHSENNDTSSFKASLVKIKGEKLELGNQDEAEKTRMGLLESKHWVASVEKKNRNRKPYPPFTTSTLQQAAAVNLRFTAKKTMRVAQQLYEGIEINEEGAVGLITYMRTDSTRLSPDAIDAAREFALKQFGKEFVPEKAIVYKSKKSAQDAHEAIRPTDVNYSPDRIKDSLTPEQLKLYQLIWQRFLACQMSQAVFEQTTVIIHAGDSKAEKSKSAEYELRANGSICIFPGWTVLYKNHSNEENENGEDVNLPQLSEGENIVVEDIQSQQHFTQPPPRFNEGSLIKELEERGIGRPSTYAVILDTILNKQYVERDRGRLHPTQLGRMVTELLVESFPDILDVDFTAGMEEKLDGVEEGRFEWINLMKEFYQPFSKTMEKARIEMRDVKREEVPTEHECDICNKTMVIKWGRNGYFLACSGYPACKNTKEIKSRQGDKVEVAPVEDTGVYCDKCSKPMIIRTGRFGRFLACSGYPQCKTTKAISIGVACPTCEQGQLVERRSRKGRRFFSCDRYPECKFSVWNLPVAETCPVCGFQILVNKETKKEGKVLACPVKECGYSRPSDVDSLAS